jgi:hypothetical protein
MVAMSGSYWKQVAEEDFTVPTDRPLDDLTAELTRMLGSTDPDVRDGTAYPALATWTERGVYDDLLSGLGDGMAAGLAIGLGEDGTDSVFRRSFSVLVLGECLARDNATALLPGAKILDWGDRVATWYLRERDLRGFVPGKGWAHTVAHGADALGALAASPHLYTNELTVLLDVLADRLAMTTDVVLTAGEPDRMAYATMAILRRNLVPLRVIEPWIARVVDTATHRSPDGVDPYLTHGNAQSFLRALYLQLSLAASPPAVRSDLLLVLVDALRATNAGYLSAPA